MSQSARQRLFLVSALCFVFASPARLSGMPGFYPESDGDGGRAIEQTPPPAPETDTTAADEAYWRDVSSGKLVPEVHFTVSRESWKEMHSGDRRADAATWPGEGEERQRRALRDRLRGDRPPPPGDLPPPPHPAGRRELPPMGDGAEHRYVKATMEVGGERLDGVGLRFKGNSSYRSSGDRPRKPFKVDTDRFTEGLRFHGRTKLNFSNAFKDPTYMKEKLGYEVYRAAGLPAPQVGWARVYLTVGGLYEKQLLGLYVIVEQIDETFIERHFGADSRESLLMKPERLHDWGYLGESFAEYDERYTIKEGKDNTRLLRRLVEFLRLV